MNKGTRRLETARKFLSEHWILLTDNELAKTLEMNIVSIRRLRYRMGLIRGKENLHETSNSEVAA